MIRALFAFLFLLISDSAFSQKAKDSIVYKLPMVKDRIVYMDSVPVQNNDSTKLDTIAKKWFNSYFKDHIAISKRPNTDTAGGNRDTTGSVAGIGLFEYTVRPGYINLDFKAILSINIYCSDNYYSYKIYNIYFRPQNGTLNSIGYQNDPEYLVRLYKQKHIGLIKSVVIDRRMIKEYLYKMDLAVHQCIASLNKTMQN